MKTTMSTGNLQAILSLAEQKGLTPERMTKILSSGVLADLFDEQIDLSSRDAWRQAFGLGPLELKIKVDYNLTLEQMIVAGNYDWTNDNITAENFPVVGRGVKELVVELVHFSRVISSGDAEEELNKMGLRPAKIEEFLALGAAYQETKFPVIALASSLDGNRRVVYLDRNGAERNLDLLLDWRGFGWNEVFRFLAVRKENSES